MVVDTPFLPSPYPQFYFFKPSLRKIPKKLKIIKIQKKIENLKKSKKMKMRKNKNIESGFGWYQFFMGTRVSMKS